MNKIFGCLLSYSIEDLQLTSVAKIILAKIILTKLRITFVTMIDVTPKLILIFYLSFQKQKKRIWSYQQNDLA